MQIGMRKPPRFRPRSIPIFHCQFPHCQSLQHFVWNIATGLIFLAASKATAGPPSTAYVFPAGAQRGNAVTVRIGGHFLHDAADLHVHGFGTTAPAQIDQG